MFAPQEAAARLVNGDTADRPPVPRTVKTASALWLTAVGAGVFETAIAVTVGLTGGSATIAGLVPDIAVRVAVYLVAVFMALRLRAGDGWARVALAVTLGTLGTVSLVIEPISWLLAGGSAARFLDEADGPVLAMTAGRIVHLVAVLTALALMFAPSANAYFRERRRAVPPKG
ncbi:hypothetical protein [Spongiactinospora sp. TRM90649]|uniref:hypothetical protein n=1 Tax=Spongiactinospora sp. TRM90649 TaxID=3031114 RepID=UPI0023F61C0E|nr:hypothetical protein [Spongiactinospora sp. TRM90649]MDF5752580.1 hypothetical protein [Spongiactinospora sp. TRM90649]